MNNLESTEKGFSLSAIPEQFPGAMFTASKPDETIEFFIKNKSVMRFCKNGDIFVSGKLTTNDTEVVEGMRKFLKGQKCI